MGAFSKLFRSAALMRIIKANADKNIERKFIDKFVTDAKVNSPVKTGNLMGSINAKKYDFLGWEVKTDTGYGAYVELGTKRMAAQPFMAPAYESARKALESGWDEL